VTIDPDNVSGKGLRESTGITQQELADRAGMHKLGVAKLEQGLREPTWATVQALAKALGVTCLAFMAGDGGPETQAAPTLARPRKSSADDGDQAESKRPRGRPRKNRKTADAAQETASGKKTASSMAGKKRTAKEEGEEA